MHSPSTSVFEKQYEEKNVFPDQLTRMEQHRCDISLTRTYVDFCTQG